MTDTILSRYGALIDDPAAFTASIEQPLPVCFWVNPLKTTPEALVHELQELGVKLEPISWCTHQAAFRSYDWPKPGATLPYVAGWYYVQEEIAMAAVAALDPQPGEQVLDLCAAPGGKTAQIAVRLGQGRIIANDSKIGRMASLSGTIGRLGLTNAVVTREDGGAIALPYHQFDRVLVDAPCSGEGTLRKDFQTKSYWRPGYSEWISSVQRQILSHALQLLKPGGILVYSTCTFAPEENEAVIDRVVRDRGIVEAIDIPGLRALPGVTHWQGQAYRQDCAHARRYFPHFNNTGGFFLARIRRTDADLSPMTAEANPGLESGALEVRVPDAWDSTNSLEHQSSGSVPDQSAVLMDFCDRFGIDPVHFQSYRLLQKSKSTLWLADSTCEPPDTIPIQGAGIPFCRLSSQHWKPTTYALQRFGQYATRNVVELDHVAAAHRFLQGDMQTYAAPVDSGYVHVRYGGMDLGCGLYKAGDQSLKSQIPKTLRMHLARH